MAKIAKALGVSIEELIK